MTNVAIFSVYLMMMIIHLGRVCTPPREMTAWTGHLSLQVMQVYVCATPALRIIHTFCEGYLIKGACDFSHRHLAANTRLPFLQSSWPDVTECNGVLQQLCVSSICPLKVASVRVHATPVVNTAISMA